MVSDTIETSQGGADFESLIAELSSRFIGLAAGDVDREIDEVLRRVGAWFDIDFVVLWQWSHETPDIIVPTHHHYAEQGQQLPEPLDERQFPWYRQQMLSGRLIAISSLDDLPPEAASDRDHGRLLGIKSNLNIPLMLGGERPVGALAFNIMREERDWPAAVVKQLQLVAQLITTALARLRATKALRESEVRLSLAADAAGAGLWTLDDRTGTFWASPRARAMFGYSPDEVITLQRFEASVHPDDLPLVREAMERCRRTGETLEVEYRIAVAGEAGVRWIASRGRPVITSDAPGQRLMGISLDVSEQRRLDQALRANDARLRAGAELAGLAFYETDHRAGMLYGDDRFCDLLGIVRRPGNYAEILQQWVERMHPADRPRVLELREQLHSGKQDRVATEYRYLHPVRGEIWIDHLAAAVERDADARMVRNIGVLRNIQRQKRTEIELCEMSQRLLQAQEQERALIARELHDDLSQRLAVLAIDVARSEGAAVDAGQAATLRSVREGLVRISEDVHMLAYQLHPSVLEELGLAEALRAECERRARQGALELSSSIDALPDGIGNETALCLFRVAQEALSNATHHSKASRASVRLMQKDGGLCLAIHDDGVGFDKEQPDTRRHLGLVSMRERMRIVNGTLDIDSAPGSGTTVIAWVPVGGAAS